MAEQACASETSRTMSNIKLHSVEVRKMVLTIGGAQRFIRITLYVLRHSSMMSYQETSTGNGSNEIQKTIVVLHQVNRCKQEGFTTLWLIDKTRGTGIIAGCLKCPNLQTQKIV